MRGPEGGFYSALDADSEGEEGRFYVWDEDEMREVLAEAGLGDERRSRRCSPVGASARRGNFEGRNILHLPLGPRRPSARRATTTRAPRSTSAARKRVWPGLDDKRLCSWNALMIAALADAGAVLGRADYLDAARALRRVTS